MMRWTVPVLLLILPSLAVSQEIRSVRLGVTKIHEVRRIRGTPDRQGVTEDGRHRYLLYGEYVFYFGADSVAAFARYFPVSLRRTELEEIFGKAKTETRNPDLSLSATYSDSVSATIKRTGEVQYIEYSINVAALIRQMVTTTMPRRYDTLPTGGRMLRVGTTVSGVLATTDPEVGPGEHVQAWAIAGTAGDSATIDLLSEDFDAYLRVVGPGIEPYLINDDGAGGCDARITVRFPQDRMYRVIVESMSGVGRFTLRVPATPLPASELPCM
jgi:hypothetical protein